jgi:O-antigen/teichoic acid export membrane protein
MNNKEIANQSHDKNERQNTSWDINNAFGNYFVMLLSQGGLAIVSFLITFLLVRNIGIENYGQIAVFISAAQFAQVFLWWTANAMARFGVQELVETGLISDSFWTRTLILFLNLIVVIGFSFLWFPLVSRSFKLSADLSTNFQIYLVIWAIAMHFVFALQATKMMKEQSVLQMLEKLLSLIILVGLVVWGIVSWENTLWVFTFSPILIILACLFLLRNSLVWNPLKVKIKFERIKEFLMFSIPIPLYSLFSPLTLNYVGTIFIVNYHSKADLGFYTIATQINGLLMMMPTVLGNLLMPIFVTSNTEAGEDSLAKSYFLEILPFITFLLAVFSTVFVSIVYFCIPLFGEKYSGIGLLLWILTAGGIVSAPVLMGFFPFLFSKSTTYLALLASLFSAVTLLLFSYLLVPSYGTIGSAWAMVISLVVNTFVFELATYRQLNLGFPKTLYIALPNIFGALLWTYSFNVFVCLSVIFIGLGLVVFLDKMTYVNGFAKLKAKVWKW